MDLAHLLTELSETPGVSGHEAPIREKLRQHWEPLADALAVDALGTLIATRHGNGPEPRRRVMIAAHMDEIGLMVTRIEGEFLRFTGVGGIDTRILLSQPVMVHGEKPLPGLIGSRPPHVLPAEERSRYPGFDDLVIDTGLPARQLEKLVKVGTLVTFEQRAAQLNEEQITGKALDNRASVAAVTLLLHELQTRLHRWDVQIAATVQEEVGLKGAEVATWHTRPDIAIAIDVTFGIGVGINEGVGFKLGDGPTLIVGPNAHPKLFDLVMEAAKRLEMKVHTEPAERSSGTDGWAMQVSREGVPTAILSIPIRNMHMPVEVVALKDIERTARLCAELICSLDDETMGRLTLD
ncbi:MAG: M42 family metallopeptidase [Anaerolineae bacterium]